MNVIELDQALRKLRLSGMADVLDTRLQQAQAEQMAPLDLVAALVNDELQRRQDRLLARRHKQARFRDPDRSTSPSTRRSAAPSSSSSPPPASSPSARTLCYWARPVRARAISLMVASRDAPTSPRSPSAVRRYQPSEARPSTPLSAPACIELSCIELSRRCASTPNSNARLSRFSTPRLYPSR